MKIVFTEEDICRLVSRELHLRGIEVPADKIDIKVNIGPQFPNVDNAIESVTAEIEMNEEGSWKKKSGR